jgi:tyrosyl-tRNA synthetase
MQVDEIIAELKRGTDEVLVESELVEKIQMAEKLNKKLVVKAGFDPTAPDLHLGHTVLINKLKKFQDFGHDVVFLIGDFTGRIGDPTGKNVTRQPLSEQEVLENAKTYQEQIFKILDPKKTRVVFNNDWLGKMSAQDLIKLAASSTVARMLERDDFKKRYESNQPISIHEFMYPLLQGQDSVVLKADIELGGRDQKFNLLVGRELQKQAGQPPQVVITMPLLEGLDGVQKMSKSLDNYIGIAESAQSMFGKIMSISDGLMWRYYELLSFKSLADIQKIKRDVNDDGKNPRDVKIDLAKELIERFHDKAAAEQAHLDFTNQFQKHQVPENISEFEVPEGSSIWSVMRDAGLVKSSSEAFRMIHAGAVKLSGEKITDKDYKIEKEGVLQVGKHKFANLKTTVPLIPITITIEKKPPVLLSHPPIPKEQKIDVKDDHQKGGKISK